MAHRWGRSGERVDDRVVSETEPPLGRSSKLDSIVSYDATTCDASFAAEKALKASTAARCSSVSSKFGLRGTSDRLLASASPAEVKPPPPAGDVGAVCRSFSASIASRCASSPLSRLRHTWNGLPAPADAPGGPIGAGGPAAGPSGVFDTALPARRCACPGEKSAMP